MKTILILTAGYGEGHNTAARNIAAAVRHLGHRAEVMDLFEQTCGSVHRFMAAAYLTAINRAPRLWQAIYWFLDKTDFVQSTSFMLGNVREALLDRITQLQPAAVCSTFPAYNYFLDELRERQPLPDFLQATMVTDSLSVNSLWWKGSGDFFAVPNAETAEVMREHGVAAQRLRVTGFPVQLDFALPERRCSPPELQPGQPVRLLYIINSGKQHALPLVARLLELPQLQATIAVGRDRHLLQQLEKLVDGKPGWQLVGWTDQMPQLLMSHHLVITKAGGATVQESIAAGCPPIINQVVPGQEEGNWELIRRMDAGALAAHTRDVIDIIHQVLEDDAAALRRWRKNILADHRPDAALILARMLLQDDTSLPH